MLIKKGERTRILRMVSDSIPQTVRFDARAADGGGPVGGLVEVERATLLGRRPRDVQPLAPENRLRKGFWDTWYSVYVTPEQDTDIVFRSRHFTARRLWILLGIVLALGLIGGLGVYLVGGAGT